MASKGGYVVKAPDCSRLQLRSPLRTQPCPGPISTECALSEKKRQTTATAAALTPVDTALSIPVLRATRLLRAARLASTKSEMVSARLQGTGMRTSSSELAVQNRQLGSRSRRTGNGAGPAAKACVLQSVTDSL